MDAKEWSARFNHFHSYLSSIIPGPWSSSSLPIATIS